MMKALLAALSFLAVSAWAQPAIAPPQIGFMEDKAGSVRPVYGLAGNFLLGDPIATGVISAAFSGSFGWVKTDSTVVVMDAQGQAMATSDAPPGPALFAFTSDDKPALAFLVTSNTLLQWSGATLTPVPLDWGAIAADAVLSIAEPDPDHAAMLVQRKDGVWDVRVVLASGEADSQTALPTATPPSCMLANGDVVSSDDSGLVVYKADGSAIHIAAHLPDSFSLQQMGDRWLQLRDLTNAHEFAVTTSKDREGFYTLPEVNR
jgi:hypothetical protein